MKRIIILLLTSLMLVACGETTSLEFDSNEILSTTERTQAFRNPKDNKGKSVEFSGIIFNIIDEDDKNIYFQMHTDLENYGDSIALQISKDSGINIKEDTLVFGQGVIIGEFSGKNVLGGDVSAPMVKIDN